MTSLPFEDLPQIGESVSFFEDFWFVYPRKVGKRKARGAYTKATTRATPPEIYAGVERYIRNKPSYCDWMHPTTFLNGDHWEDEYDASSKPDPDKAWQHKAAMAKTSWGRHNVPRQDIEECHRRGLLTDDELAEALR